MQSITLSLFVVVIGLLPVRPIARADTVHSPRGFSVDWEIVSHPAAAQRLAACSPHKLYILNTDKSLYVSYQGGVDGSWQYVTTPGSADSIACDGSTLFVLNGDKSLWREVVSAGGQWLGWVQLSNANEALLIGGGPRVLTALNYNQSVWTSVADKRSAFPGVYWSYRDTAGVAARISGCSSSGHGDRFFALNDDGSLWYNSALAIAAPGAWIPFPSALPAGVQPLEIATADVNLLYVLDSENNLWTAKPIGLPTEVIIDNGTALNPEY